MANETPQRDRLESTTQWIRRRSPTITRGSTTALVAMFIASSDAIYGIINDGIAGKPMNHWVAIKVLFIMAIAGAHNLSAYTDPTHQQWREKLERAPPDAVPPKQTESEWLKSNIVPSKK